MSRRFSIRGSVAAAALALLAVPAFGAAAPEPPRATSAPRLTSLEAALDAIFSKIQTSNLATTQLPPDFEPGQVLVARVKDGKHVLACVDSKEAATRFLNAPVEKVRAAKMEEK